MYIKNGFYWLFGKWVAKFFGIETYAKIEALEELKYVPNAWRMRPHNIIVSFHVDGEYIHTSGIASNIELLDAKKLEIGTRIRIKYLKDNPNIIYISEFRYIYKEAQFE